MRQLLGMIGLDPKTEPVRVGDLSRVIVALAVALGLPVEAMFQAVGITDPQTAVATTLTVIFLVGTPIVRRFTTWFHPDNPVIRERPME